MSTPTDPTPDPGPQPETAPDGHTWLPQDYCVAQHMWAPPDPQHMVPEYPAWQLPAWYEGRTGMVQIPGPPGRPGTYQYVWDGYLPWQSRSDTYVLAEQWPDAVQVTVGDMQAALWPPAPVAEVPAADVELVPLIALSSPGDADVPPLGPDNVLNSDPTERN